jgi:hypothetical protein
MLPAAESEYAQCIPAVTPQISVTGPIHRFVCIGICILSVGQDGIGETILGRAGGRLCCRNEYMREMENGILDGFVLQSSLA